MQSEDARKLLNFTLQIELFEQKQKIKTGLSVIIIMFNG